MGFPLLLKSVILNDVSAIISPNLVALRATYIEVDIRSILTATESSPYNLVFGSMPLHDLGLW